MQLSLVTILAVASTVVADGRFAESCLSRDMGSEVRWGLSPGNSRIMYAYCGDGRGNYLYSNLDLNSCINYFYGNLNCGG